MEKKQITRKELYELLCAMPLTKLADEYSISANGLRRICRENKIPLPPNGHWSKMNFGKPSELMILPDDYSGSLEINLDEIKMVKNTESLGSLLTQNSGGIKETNEFPVKVPQRLANPDPLIISTINYYDAIKRRKYGDNKPYPDRTNVLSISVSLDSTARAYRIMDTVIKLLRVRKYDIKIKYSDKTVAVSDGEEVAIRLREKYRVSAEKDKWGGRLFEATGKLVFMIGDYPKKEIQDGLDLLETKISSIIAYIESDIERSRKWRIEAEERRKLAEEKRKIEAEIKEKKDKESQNFKDLFIGATRLHQANIIREYIKTVETRAVKYQQLTTELNNWIEWANKKADWYDPLISEEDPLLDENYKANIFKELLKEWQ
jgi:hypothetical protein